MTAMEALFESWRRQTACMDHLCSLLDDRALDAKAAPSSDTIGFHLCHVHETRSYWLFKASGQKSPDLIDLYHQVDGEWYPSRDLARIREQLQRSARAVEEWMASSLDKPGVASGPYDHPVLFLQHMLWHEGYHFGVIMLALREAGREPTQEWEEENVWGLWRHDE